jgi:hypothetical protein
MTTEDKLDNPLLDVKWRQIAPSFGLEPESTAGMVTPKIPVYQYRTHNELFQDMLDDLKIAEQQYDDMMSLVNEEARSSYIAALFSRIVSLFGSVVSNQPERLLASKVSGFGGMKHHFPALAFVGMVLIEIKPGLPLGGSFDVKAQLFAECS